MVNVEVRLFAYFREGRWKKKIIQVQEDSTISEILKIINIDEEDAHIVILNGRDGPTSRTIADGDILALFPPVGGG